MFSKRIVDTDAFLDMPLSARLLYYDLAMRADDDGFVASPKKILRVVGCSEDDLETLIARQFIIPFQSGICVIRDWRIHNYIRSDRYRETQYIAEKRQLILCENGAYQIAEQAGMTDGIPNDNQTSYQRETQARLGKDSIGQDNPPIVPPGDGETDIQTSGESVAEEAAGEPAKDSHSMTRKRRKTELSSEQRAAFEQFWTIWPNKVSKGQAESTWAKLNPSGDFLEMVLAGVRRAMSHDPRFQTGFTPHASTWLNAKGWEDEWPPEPTDNRRDAPSKKKNYDESW
jgi:hypothetical protein